MSSKSESTPTVSTIPTVSTPCTTGSELMIDFDHVYDKDTVTASPPKFSNIVLKSDHDADINLNVLFNILPIEYKTELEIKTQLTEADNHKFLNVRKYPKSRGFAKATKIKSFVDIDYYLNKKFHIKISSKRIAVIGGSSFEHSENLFKNIYEFINKLNKRWIKFKDIKSDRVDKVFDIYKNNLDPSDLSELELDFVNFLKTSINSEYEIVNDRLKDIKPFLNTPLCLNNPKYNGLKICNTVHNYRLPTEISLLEKSQHLYYLGYKIFYHNTIQNKFFKAIYILNENTNEEKKFTFTIQNIGTIKQNSNNSEEDSIMLYRKIVTDLGFVPYYEGAPKFALKQAPKKNKSVQLSDKAKSILDKYLLIKT